MLGLPANFQSKPQILPRKPLLVRPVCRKQNSKAVIALAQVNWNLVSGFNRAKKWREETHGSKEPWP
jgi:hypothetical protein